MERILKIIFIALSCWSLAAFAQNPVTPKDSSESLIDTVANIFMEEDSLELTDTIPADFSYLDSSYLFIRFSADTLYLGKDSLPMVHFYEKLQRVIEEKQGNVSILHIGGSHVQAGTMSHRIRKHILSEYDGPAASRGMIFPYSAASNCNNPHDYKTSKEQPLSLVRNVYRDHTIPLGVTGIAVYAPDTLRSFRIRMNEPDFDFGADTIVLLTNYQGKTSDFKEFPIDPILKEDTIYHFPDSEDVANGRIYYFLNKLVQDFTIYLPCSKGDTFAVNGILLKNGRPGITFHSLGVNGAQVTSYLRCKNFTRDLELIRPDLVIFGIGVNDAYGDSFDSVAFKNNYLKLVQRFKTINPDCAFLFLSNNDTWKKSRRSYYVNKTGPEVSDVMYRLADLTGGAVWDQFNIMGGLGSMDKWRLKGLAQKDRVHFTAAGYNLIADLFYKAFIRELNYDNR